MAAAFEERRAALMAYCRIDVLEEGEEAVLRALYEGAVEYLAGAGVAQQEGESSRRSLYDLCVNHMVLDGWDNRGSQTADVTLEENPAFRRMLNQLKLTQPTM